MTSAAEGHCGISGSSCLWLAAQVRPFGCLGPVQPQAAGCPFWTLCCVAGGADQSPCLVPKVWLWHPGARHPTSPSSPFLLLILLLPPPSSSLTSSLHPILFPPPPCLPCPPFSPSSSLHPESTFQPRGGKQGRFPSSAWQGSKQ